MRAVPDLFPLLMGLSWLVGKIVVKRIVRRLARQDFSLSETVAFLGVDLSVLSLSLWIGLRLHERFPGDYETKVMLYFEFAVIVFLAACSYRAYFWASARAGGVWKNLCVTCVVCFGLFVGSLFFAATSFAMLRPLVAQIETVSSSAESVNAGS